MKSLTNFSGSSVGDLGIPENMRFSLMLRDCRSSMFSFIILFSAVTVSSLEVTVASFVAMVETDCCSVLFSCVILSI